MKQDLLINDKLTIGNEILAYLVDHPQAQDTLEGIVEWWLLEWQIKFQKSKVKVVLSDLVAKGLIIEKTGSNSKTHYQVNKSKHKKSRSFSSRKLGDFHWTGYRHA